MIHRKCFKEPFPFTAHMLKLLPQPPTITPTVVRIRKLGLRLR